MNTTHEMRTFLIQTPGYSCVVPPRPSIVHSQDLVSIAGCKTSRMSPDEHSVQSEQIWPVTYNAGYVSELCDLRHGHGQF